MGKSLIIKGADFSESAINTIFNEVQTSLGTNLFYNDSGSVTEYSGIEGVSVIEIPDNASILSVVYSSTGYEPDCINCFDENLTQLGLSGGAAVGVFNSLGTHDFILPEGTKYISYVYKSTIYNIDIGLALKWSKGL